MNKSYHQQRNSTSENFIFILLNFMCISMVRKKKGKIKISITEKEALPKYGQITWLCI